MYKVRQLLGKFLVLWLLLAVPAQVLAALTPCDARHHGDTSHMQHQHESADVTDHHVADHVADHAKCSGSCCMGWMAPASVVLPSQVAGAEQIPLIPPHFTGFIAETPQHPPNPVFA